MSQLAKIVRFHEPGGADVLRVEDLPVPEPGPGEVRLRVKAIGLNRAEIMFRNDRYLVRPKLPSPAMVVALILLSPFCLTALARLGRHAPIATRLALRDLDRYRARSG